MSRVKLSRSTQAAVTKALPHGISAKEAEGLAKQITRSKTSGADKVKQLKALRDQHEVSFTPAARRTVDRAIFEAVNEQNAKGWKPKPNPNPVRGGGGGSGGS